MTMVSSGQISLGGTGTSGGLNQSVNVELGRSGTAQITMNESAVRTLAGVPSGQISLSNFYGKANQFSFTISANQTNANLRTLAVNAGWNQSTKVVATISSGVIISSNGTGTPALTVSGSFPGGVELINSGVIVGMGGAGGSGGMFSGDAKPGASGGTALSVSTAISINNAGTIAGGGGGGGGGSTAFDGKSPYAGGGGGGGRSSNAANSAGGSANSPAGAGGAGTYSAAGGGGAGHFVGGAGGSGGDWGAAGANGGTGTGGLFPGAGGAGGNAVTGNSNITWIAFGTRLGGIS